MSTLVTIYWLCFGVGLVYVLLSGALGAISHGFAGGHGDGHTGDTGDGHDLGDVADHDASGALEGFDAHDAGLPAAELSPDAPLAEAPGHAVGEIHASGMPEYSPFSLLSLMGTLAGFGAGGLLGVSYGVGTLVSLGAAAVGALGMSVVLWLLIGKLLYGLHASSEAHVSDMIGLEAEVLTPVEHDMSGEIAYILDGTRYTAPARLLHQGRVGKTEKVRIRRVGTNLVYVEERRKLLS